MDPAEPRHGPEGRGGDPRKGRSYDDLGAHGPRDDDPVRFALRFAYCFFARPVRPLRRTSSSNEIGRNTQARVREGVSAVLEEVLEEETTEHLEAGYR